MNGAIPLQAPAEGPAVPPPGYPVAAVPPAPPASPLALIAAFIDKLDAAGIDADKATAVMRGLQEMHFAERDRQARESFCRALGEFHATCPQVPRSQTAKIPTRGGTSYSYTYADLETIDRVIRPELAKHRLSWHWSDTDVDEKDRLRVRCVLTHADGASQSSVSPFFPTTSASGMSDQQRYTSALTVAKRASLTAVLGLTTVDPPSDGGDEPPVGEFVTQEQYDELTALFKESGAEWKAVGPWLKKSCGCDDLETLPASRFGFVKSTLLTRRDRMNEGSQ